MLKVLAGAAADMATFERGMLSGGSNIRPIGAYPPATLRFSQGAPVHGFDPAAHFDERTLGGLDRFTQFAAVAARQAWASSMPNRSMGGRRQRSTLRSTARVRLALEVVRGG